LKQLALPASHDSGMYLGGLATLGKTQDLSIYGQLADGIRYFDLRPNGAAASSTSPTDRSPGRCSRTS